MLTKHPCPKKKEPIITLKPGSKFNKKCIWGNGLDKMTMHIASVLESPRAKIGDHFSGESTSQHQKRILMYISKPMLGPVQLCQLSGWKRFLFTAGCLKNKNVFKL